MRLPRLRAVTPNWQIVSVKAVTTACRHGPFPAFGGTRNDRVEKRFLFLYRDLGQILKYYFSTFMIYMLNLYSHLGSF